MGKMRIFIMLIVIVFVLTSCVKPIVTQTVTTTNVGTTTQTSIPTSTTTSAPTSVPTSIPTVMSSTTTTTTPTTTDKTPNPIQVKMNQYIDQLINETPSYIPAWNNEGFKGRWNYVDGVFLNAIVNLYNETKIDKYKYFFLNYINYYINENGEFIHPETKELYFNYGELDSICESKILFDAYEMTNDNRYLKAIENSYNALMDISKAGNTSNFSHKERYLNQVWLDGMYMYVPFYLRYANLKGNNNIEQTVKSQYEFIRNNMFDETKELYYHANDTTKSIFWANKTTGNSQSFWLRGNGWYIMSLVDAIEYVKDGNVAHYLKGLLKEALVGILKHQSDSKLFYQLVDQGSKVYKVPASYLKGLKNEAYKVNDEYVDTNIRNYLESSGSSMIAYALLKASRLGYVEDLYSNKGLEVFEALFNTKVSTTNGIHLNDICITAGLGPEDNTVRDGTPYYYLAEPVGSDDAKGVGPFILAYLEYNKII